MSSRECVESNFALTPRGIDFSLSAITDLVPRLFTLTSYGFHASDFARLVATVEIPVGLCGTYWEARDMSMIPQKDGHSRALKARDLMVQRKAAREQVSKEQRWDGD